MLINWRTLRLFIPVILAAGPSISFAADASHEARCTPLPEAVCLAHFTKAECYKYRRDCEKPAVTRRASPPNEALTANIDPPMPAPPPKPPLIPQFFFLRADKLDNPYPGLSAAPSAGGALGASVSYTGNDFVQATKTTKFGSYVNVSTTQSVTVTGLASYAFLDPLGDPWNISGPDRSVTFVPSFSVSANGSWDQPTKSFGDTSALKVGPEFAFLYDPGGPLFQTFLAYVSVAPFYQTDFYGKASAEGATLSFTPAYQDWLLFGPNPNFSKYTGGLFDGFLEVRAEATYLNVGQPGQTLLHQGSYEWLGGAVRSYIFFFPSYGGLLQKADYPWLVDRLSFVGTYQNYWDANSHATAGLFSAALQYKIGTCDSSAEKIARPGKQPVTCQFGAPSVSAQYDWGTDRDTLQHTKKITVKSSYAY
jgi:hypothetical protein